MKKIIIIYFLFLSILFTSFSFSEEKFLSLKKNKVNVRYGPSFDSKIKYIYKKINLPVRLIDTKENFRRIIDLENNSGWIHHKMLRPSNSFIILGNRILFKEPSFFSRPIVKLEKGRLLVIRKCENNWCNVTTEKYSGWVKNDTIWGLTK